MNQVPDSLRNSHVWNRNPQWWGGVIPAQERVDYTIWALKRYESRNVTFFEADGSWPIVWAQARGSHVWDEFGRKYLDLTAGFGVAALGHANPRVVKAGQRQMSRLLHAMGDVHPHALKARLAEVLSELTFGRWWYQYKKCSGAPFGSDWLGKGKTIFCSSGSEAVEAALKTAMLATRKKGVIAFEGAYHGLGYGALNVTQREHFKFPFRKQLAEFAEFAPFPTHENELPKVERKLKQLFRKQQVGAIIVEPIQARAGVRIPPTEFYWLLRRLADKHGAVLIFDEIYTGFGRTGHLFACERASISPDIVCLGKALTGGFPLSACVGRSQVMDAAWPPSTGEAIHTSTFLGHPVGCAMALAQIEALKLGYNHSKDWVHRSARLGRILLTRLKKLTAKRITLDIRGEGLMVGMELLNPDGSPATEAVLECVKRLLKRRILVLPEGEFSNVIGITPPLTITERQLAHAVECLKQVLQEIEA